MRSITAYCAQSGNFHEVAISMLKSFLTHNDKRERVMTFEAKELPTFSIKRFNLQKHSKFQ